MVIFNFCSGRFCDGRFFVDVGFFLKVEEGFRWFFFLVYNLVFFELKIGYYGKWVIFLFSLFIFYNLGEFCIFIVV